jgi:hypothetical protein
VGFSRHPIHTFDFLAQVVEIYRMPGASCFLEEFDAGDFSRLSGEPQCLGATRSWRDGRAGESRQCLNTKRYKLEAYSPLFVLNEIDNL